ncbi:MAG: PfkB family carbohydrate kinase [Bacteroidota bacterium]
MYDICCIGHITLDKVVTAQKEVYMAGGTSFYFSNAIQNMGLRYHLVTALAETEMHFVQALQAQRVDVTVLPSRYTVNFENIYPENQDHRVQRVLQKAEPFQYEQLKEIDAKIFHLGPLLADDIPAELIQALASKSLVSLDVQGYLREVINENVYPIDWPQKKALLPNIAILKANENEMEMLTGQTDIYEGAKILADWGVKEVVITLGSKGSVILYENIFYLIPAFVPNAVIDATGCGDTYMAGYLSRRIIGEGVQQAGEFAAAMATLKIQVSGPFTGGSDEILSLLVKKNTRI